MSRPATRRFAAILASWIGRLRDEFPDAAVLELGAERDEPINFADLETDPLVAAIVPAGS